MTAKINYLSIPMVSQYFVSLRLVIVIISMPHICVSQLLESDAKNWKFNLSQGISVPLNPNAFWHNLDEDVILIGVHVADLIDEIESQFGGQFFNFPYLDHKTKVAFTVNGSLERRLFAMWYIRARCSYHRHELIGKQDFGLFTGGIITTGSAITRIRLIETHVLFGRKFGHGVVRPLLNGGAGLTFWNAKNSEGELAGYTFPVFGERRHTSWSIIFGTGLETDFTSRIRFHVQAETLLLLKSLKRAPGVVENLAITTGLSISLF